MLSASLYAQSFIAPTLSDQFLSNVTTSVLGMPNNGAFSIYNLMGVTVALGSFSEQGSIDVSGLASGMYLLKAEGKTYKFTKQ